MQHISVIGRDIADDFLLILILLAARHHISKSKIVFLDVSARAPQLIEYWLLKGTAGLNFS